MELVGLVLVLLVALGVVILLTRGVFSRDLTNALKRVTQQEQVLQEKADIVEQRLREMERDYQAKLKRAEAEAARLIEESKQQAMNIRTAAIEEAKYRARQLLLEVEQGRTQVLASVEKELQGKMVRQTGELLGSLLPREHLVTLHEHLVRELLKSLKQLQVGSLRPEVAHVDVKTAKPFSSESSQQLAQWTVTSFGPTVPLHVDVDPSLVAGCVVRLGGTTVDNCLLNRLATR